MTKPEFRSMCFEILFKQPVIESNGQRYFPQSSVVELIEFIGTQVDLEKELQVGDVDIEGKIVDTLNRAFSKISESVEAGRKILREGEIKHLGESKI